MEKIKVNMSPNPLDVQTIHASQNDGEARQWGFKLHNNGDVIDSSEVTDQMVFKAYKGGTEQLLPENTSTPTTSPFKGDIRYPQGLLTDQEFTYRQSPTEEDGLAKFTSIKGNTLGWNQLVPSLSTMSAQNGTLSVADSVATITSSSSVSYLGIATSGSSIVLPKGGHKYLLTVEVKSPKALSSCNLWYGNSIAYIQRNIPANTWTKVSTIASYGSPSGQYIQLRAYGSFEQGDTLQVRNWNYFDLTAMGLDSLTEDEFTSLFPLSYYDFNQGSLLSFNGNGIKTVGKNLFDEQLELGTIDANGNNSAATNRWRSKNYIPCFPNTRYVFSKNGVRQNVNFQFYDADKNYLYNGIGGSAITTPSNAHYLRFFYNDEINVSSGLQLEFGSSATEYEPYTSSTLSLPISTYFPNGMKSAGNVYDELTESKAITRIGAVDLGSLTYTMATDTEGYVFFRATLTGIKRPPNSNIDTNRICSSPFYKTTGSTNANYNAHVNSINTPHWVDLYIIDNSVSSADELKTKLQGVYLYYELATYEETSFTTASLVTENAEIPLSNEDGTLIGKCTEQLSENPGFIDAKIKLSDSDGECYSNKIQLHIERSPQ